jgi:hypothetical protein
MQYAPCDPRGAGNDALCYGSLIVLFLLFQLVFCLVLPLITRTKFVVFWPVAWFREALMATVLYKTLYVGSPELALE